MKAEEAYQNIAMRLLAEFEGDHWDLLVANYELSDNFARVKSKAILQGKTFYSNKNIPVEVRGLATDSALFLREDLNSTSGNLISGLEFTINKDGKFNIKYSYAD